MAAADSIPVADPGAQLLGDAGRLARAAIEDVLSSNSLILGPNVSAFEAEFAAFIGGAHCQGVASGTDAIALALRAVGCAPGDEVITVSHTAVATVAAVEQIGAVPVLVDIEPDTLCMDPARVAAATTERTRAVLPVHIYGHPARMDDILAVARELGLSVVEDCAQAHGARIGTQSVGTFGDAAAFSFYPTKNLGAVGDGGAVVTASRAVSEQVSLLRQYGWVDRISMVPGVNSRLDEVQAAVLRTRLPRLAGDVERRRQIAQAYRDAIGHGPLVAPRELVGYSHAMHLFVVQSETRDAFRQYMADCGVSTGLHYPAPVHRQPAYAGRIRTPGGMAETERLYDRIASLPMYPELSDSQVETVCAALRGWGEHG